MRITSLLLATIGGLALVACANQGAVGGSTAADRDGDGVVDGYYTSDGMYHPNYTPSPPPPVSPQGERG